MKNAKTIAPSADEAEAPPLPIPPAPEAIAPTLSTDPSEEEKADWRRSSGRDAAALLLDHDTALLRTTAMALIDYEANGGTRSRAYFNGVLSAMGLTNAGDKVMMPVATVASGWDRTDKMQGDLARKNLDALATAIEGASLLAKDQKLALAYSAASVEKLVAAMKAAGGYRKVANLARNVDIETAPRGVIALDGSRVRDIAKRNAEKLLDAVSGDFLAIEGTEVRLNRSVVEEAMIRQDLEHGVIQRLNILVRAASLIERQKTEKLKNVDADPKGAAGKKAEKRVTEPHLLYRANGNYVLSGHMATAGNVIEIEGLGEVLEGGTDEDLVMPPQVHRKLALNLADAPRRNALEIKQEQPAPGTQNVRHTYRLRSDAALHPDFQPSGKGLSFSWMVPTYRHRDPEDTVRVVRPDRRFETVATIKNGGREGFLAAFAKNHVLFNPPASKQKRIDCRIERDSNGKGVLFLELDKGHEPSCWLDGEVTPCAFSLPAADLRNWLVYANETLTEDGSVTLSLDEGRAAVCWEFASHGAQWKLYMPCTGKSGVRLTDAFEPITLVRPEMAKAA